MRRLLLSIPLLLALFSSPGLSALQGESIFVKALVGGNFTMMSESVDNINISLNGVGGLGYLQFGGSLSRAVKVYGFTGLSMTPKPKVKTENIKIDTVYDSFTIFDLGLGIGLYSKGGQSISVGGSIAASYFKYNVYGTDVGTYTRHGWGAHVILSQEFPMSAHWSAGLNLVGYYGTVFDVGPAPFANTPVTNMYVGIAGSLMYD